jgi:hypothetical protein
VVEQREYEEFKIRINALVAKAQNKPRDGWKMADGTPWPGNLRSDHVGMIQVSAKPPAHSAGLLSKQRPVSPGQNTLESVLWFRLFALRTHHCKFCNPALFCGTYHFSRGATGNW